MQFGDPSFFPTSSTTLASVLPVGLDTFFASYFNREMLKLNHTEPARGTSALVARATTFFSYSWTGTRLGDMLEAIERDKYKPDSYSPSNFGLRIASSRVLLCPVVAGSLALTNFRQASHPRPSWTLSITSNASPSHVLVKYW